MYGKCPRVPNSSVRCLTQKRNKLISEQRSCNDHNYCRFAVLKTTAHWRHTTHGFLAWIVFTSCWDERSRFAVTKIYDCRRWSKAQAPARQYANCWFGSIIVPRMKRQTGRQTKISVAGGQGTAPLHRQVNLSPRGLKID